jgi:histidinol phosphatase-like PHP family hydrolase
VELGTNLKAAESKNVNILAHPGLLTKDVADQCKKNNVFVEDNIQQDAFNYKWSYS